MAAAAATRPQLALYHKYDNRSHGSRFRIVRANPDGTTEQVDESYFTDEAEQMLDELLETGEYDDCTDERVKLYIRGYCDL